MQEFKRDASGALVNADKSATLAYKQQRDRTKLVETDINTLKTKVTALEAAITKLIEECHDRSK